MSGPMRATLTSPVRDPRRAATPPRFSLTDGWANDTYAVTPTKLYPTRAPRNAVLTRSLTNDIERTSEVATDRSVPEAVSLRFANPSAFSMSISNSTVLDRALLVELTLDVRSPCVCAVGSSVLAGGVSNRIVLLPASDAAISSDFGSSGFGTQVVVAQARLIRLTTKTKPSFARRASRCATTPCIRPSDRCDGSTHGRCADDLHGEYGGTGERGYLSRPRRVTISAAQRSGSKAKSHPRERPSRR